VQKSNTSIISPAALTEKKAGNRRRCRSNEVPKKKRAASQLLLGKGHDMKKTQMVGLRVTFNASTESNTEWILTKGFFRITLSFN
jgi:hypothetical protein